MSYVIKILPENGVAQDNIFNSVDRIETDQRITFNFREVPVCNANAAVYMHDPITKSWKAGDGGLSRVGIYHNPGANTYRVVALDAKNNAPTINSAIFKTLVYQKASETFHQWTEPRGSYGLNFASPAAANSFAASMADCINRLKNGETSSLMTDPLIQKTEMKSEANLIVDKPKQPEVKPEKKSKHKSMQEPKLKHHTKSEKRTWLPLRNSPRGENGTSCQGIY